jgi:hypothetical protein
MLTRRGRARPVRRSPWERDCSVGARRTPRGGAPLGGPRTRAIRRAGRRGELSYAYLIILPPSARSAADAARVPTAAMPLGGASPGAIRRRAPGAKGSQYMSQQKPPMSHACRARRGPPRSRTAAAMGPARCGRGRTLSDRSRVAGIHCYTSLTSAQGAPDRAGVVWRPALPQQRCRPRRPGAAMSAPRRPAPAWRGPTTPLDPPAPLKRPSLDLLGPLEPQYGVRLEHTEFSVRQYKHRDAFIAP